MTVELGPAYKPFKIAPHGQSLVSTVFAAFAQPRTLELLPSAASYPVPPTLPKTRDSNSKSQELPAYSNTRPAQRNHAHAPFSASRGSTPSP
ncbi:hypothetical protein U0070_024766 [Myodes glareolus]|uniref:Uncharacterized protein n=1 Tax=Myodes glareolus TaxID=447135 RepID=A0AAW0H710_MYOGA